MKPSSLFLLSYFSLFLCCLGLLTLPSVAEDKNARNEASAEIQLELPGVKFVHGDPIKIEIIKKRVPPGSSVALYLLPVLREKNTWPAGVRKTGCSGSLTASSIEVWGNGSHEFLWNGRATWSAPADAPVQCENILKGHYFVEAHLFNETDVRLVGFVPPPPEPVRSVVTNPFRIE